MPFATESEWGEPHSTAVTSTVGVNVLDSTERESRVSEIQFGGMSVSARRDWRKALEFGVRITYAHQGLLPGATGISRDEWKVEGLLSYGGRHLSVDGHLGVR